MGHRKKYQPWQFDQKVRLLFQAKEHGLVEHHHNSEKLAVIHEDNEEIKEWFTYARSTSS